MINSFKNWNNRKKINKKQKLRIKNIQQKTNFIQNQKKIKTFNHKC